MTSPRHLPGATLLAGLVLIAGCGSASSGADTPGTVTAGPATSDSTSPEVSTTPETSVPAASPTASTAGANGRANLVLSGAITQRLTDAPAFCNYYYPSEKRGVVYTVDASSFSLQVSDSEGDGRTVAILNVTAPDAASYTSRPDTPGTLVAKLDRSGARVDVDLRRVASAETVHLSGTIVCAS